MARSSTPVPEGSLAGVSAHPLLPGSFGMPLIRRSTNADRPRTWGWSTSRTVDRRIWPSNTPRGWPRQASNHLSAALVTVTPPPWPRRSMDSSKPKLSTAAAHGAGSKPWNTQPSNRSTGSKTAAASNPSETSRPPRPKQPLCRYGNRSHGCATNVNQPSANPKRLMTQYPIAVIAIIVFGRPERN